MKNYRASKELKKEKGTYHGDLLFLYQYFLLLGHWLLYHNIIFLLSYSDVQVLLLEFYFLEECLHCVCLLKFKDKSKVV